MKNILISVIAAIISFTLGFLLCFNIFTYIDNDDALIAYNNFYRCTSGKSICEGAASAKDLYGIDGESSERLLQIEKGIHEACNKGSLKRYTRKNVFIFECAGSEKFIYLVNVTYDLEFGKYRLYPRMNWAWAPCYGNCEQKFEDMFPSLVGVG